MQRGETRWPQLGFLTHSNHQYTRYWAQLIAMDVSGRALKDVGDMVARLFVVWGWSLLGTRVSCGAVCALFSYCNSANLAGEWRSGAGDEGGVQDTGVVGASRYDCGRHVRTSLFRGEGRYF